MLNAGGAAVAAAPRAWAVNAALVLLGLALIAMLDAVTGRVPIEGGRGWDGSDYVDMLEGGWDQGTPNTALRPLIVLLNLPVFRLTGNAVLAFRIMNYAYFAVLCLVLCLLVDRYAGGVAAKALLVVNVFLSIATAKYAAYYPVLIDPGALAIQALALYFLVSGRRAAAAAACVAAALSREFAVAVIAFGICRDLRQRAPLLQTALTVGPALAVYAGWRWLVAARFAERQQDGIGLAQLLGNLSVWSDPVFVAFFVYFLATLLGGVTLFLFAHPRIVARFVRREPEWGIFSLLIVAAAMTGSADIWRYLVYLLPACAVFFAVCARDVGLSAQRPGLAAAIVGATVLTQRPLQHIDLGAYFRDWFPYYARLGRVPSEAEKLALWPVWGWRLATAAALWLAFTMVALTRRSPHSDAHA